MLEEVVDTAPGTYLSAAGIQLMPSFYEHFTLLNEGEGGTLRFADVADENAQEYVLSYFRCRPGVADQDCKHLEETFAQNSPRSLTTRHGVTYYKSQQVNTWFANNHQRWGLMISDVPESVITLLKDDLLLVNEKSLKDREKSIAPRLCQQEGQQMNTVKKVSYHLETEGLVAQFAGSSSDSELSCSVLVDLGISNQGKLLSMEVGKALKEAETQSGSNTATQQSGTLGASEASEGNQKIVAPLQRNPQVPQFPLNPEKALRYQSARGYVAILPSPNLSYTVSMTQENFGQAGLKCGNLIKVVKYADKELLESSPAVEIYECSAKSPLASLGEQFLVVESVGKTFVIKINDPAWISFAQQLSFTALEA